MSDRVTNNVPGGKFARMYHAERSKNLDLQAQLGQVRLWFQTNQFAPGSEEMREAFTRLQGLLYPNAENALTLLEELLGHDDG